LTKIQHLQWLNFHYVHFGTFLFWSVKYLNLPVIKTKMAQIIRGMKRIKPPNAVDRYTSKTVWPISIPAIVKQRKISINPMIIIQIRGHRKCNPYLLKVFVNFDVPDLNAILTWFYLKYLCYASPSLSLVLKRREKKVQFWICNFVIPIKKKMKEKKINWRLF
jgi:hypothetical protein